MRFMPPWEILDPPLVIVMCLPHWEKIIITVVDPGFPMGSCGPHRGSVDS